MADKLTLEILIKTILDGRGVQAGNDEIKQLAATMKSTASEGKAVEASVQGVVDALQRQRSSTKEVTTEWSKLSAEQKQDQRDLAQRAVRMLENEEAQKKAAAASRLLSTELGSLRLAGQGVSKIINGLAQGDLPGLINAARGTADVWKAVSSGAGTVINTVGRMSPVIAAVGAAVFVANNETKKNLAEMNKAWDAAAKNRENYTRVLEATAARNAAALKLELAAVEKLAAAYDSSRQRTEQSYGREDSLTPAKRERRDAELKLEEAQALKKAGTPAERAKIQTEFERRRRNNEISDKAVDFASDESKADTQTRKAEEAQANARQARRDAQAEVEKAQREFDQALRAAQQFKRKDLGRLDADGNRMFVDDTSSAALAARARARDAAENLKQKKAAAGEIGEASAKIISSAQEEIDAARLVKEETAERRAAWKAMIKLASVERGNKTTAAVADNAADAKAANSQDSSGNRQADPGAAPKLKIKGEITTGDGRTIIANDGKPGKGGTISRGGETVQVDGAGTIEALKKNGEVLGQVFKTIEYVTGKSTAAAEKLNRKLQNTAQANAGG